MPDPKIDIGMTPGFRKAIKRLVIEALNEQAGGHDCQLLTEEIVAKRLKLSVRRLNKHLIETGHITVVTLPETGERRIPLASLQALLDRMLAEGGGE